MNTKLYKQVHSLAGELLAAAEAGDDKQFHALYLQLRTLCQDNEADERKNHPVQWETLADFTEDAADALRLYEKALGIAESRQARDYMASICYAMALLLFEEAAPVGNLERARLVAQQASEYASRIEDDELKSDIAALIKQLSS